MKRMTRLFIGILLLILAADLSAAPRPIPKPPSVAAEGYLILDFNSGQVIAESKADQRMEPASLTKLMTAYIVFAELKSGNIHLNDMVTVSEKAWRMPGSRMFIEVGKQASVEELLQGMIIQSGNDATVALAEFVAGGEDAFATLMNQQALALGMNASHFTNSTGLPDGEHYTTARDIGLLTRALIRRFPEYYKWYSVRKYTYNGITQYNRNKLLWRDESVDGVKTGHTESAGFCLVTSAERDGMRLLTVVMGANSEDGRAQESQKLLNYGFRFFETHLLYASDKPVTTVRIWKGESEDLPLGVAEDLYVTVPRGQYKSLNALMNIEAKIIAPTAKGEKHGTLNISIDDKELAQRPLIALMKVDEGGLWQLLVDNVKLMFH